MNESIILEISKNLSIRKEQVESTLKMLANIKAKDDE